MLIKKKFQETLTKKKKTFSKESFFKIETGPLPWNPRSNKKESLTSIFKCRINRVTYTPKKC